MKQFNLERAKAGDPVITRDGRKVRIVCFDAKIPPTTTDPYPIIALIEYTKDSGFECMEFICNYTVEGKALDYINVYGHSPKDLLMAPIKKTLWYNVYRNDNDGGVIFGSPYETEQEAKRADVCKDAFETRSIDVNI